MIQFSIKRVLMFNKIQTNKKRASLWANEKKIQILKVRELKKKYIIKEWKHKEINT